MDSRKSSSYYQLIGYSIVQVSAFQRDAPRNKIWHGIFLLEGYMAKSYQPLTNRHHASSATYIYILWPASCPTHKPRRVTTCHWLFWQALIVASTGIPQRLHRENKGVSPWKGAISRGHFIFQPSIFRRHVSFQEDNTFWGSQFFQVEICQPGCRHSSSPIC